jgi:hypothetical protein
VLTLRGDSQGGYGSAEGLPKQAPRRWMQPGHVLLCGDVANADDYAVLNAIEANLCEELPTLKGRVSRWPARPSSSQDQGSSATALMIIYLTERTLVRGRCAAICVFLTGISLCNICSCHEIEIVEERPGPDATRGRGVRGAHGRQPRAVPGHIFARNG